MSQNHRIQRDNLVCLSDGFLVSLEHTVNPQLMTKIGRRIVVIDKEAVKQNAHMTTSFNDCNLGTPGCGH